MIFFYWLVPRSPVDCRRETLLVADKVEVVEVFAGPVVWEVEEGSIAAWFPQMR